ncbi:MAG: sugar phosphate nucleotidyltransferase [Flavobacteriales bacterium]|tara:strand:- start:2283 stop:3128 length:846 start_codon:yes stop_codon:yes gene_type:complete
MIQSLLIMAAGASSRMKSSVAKDIGTVATEQANNRTKGLIEIGEDGKPLLYYLLRNAQVAGYKTIYLITAADATFFRSTIRSLPNLNQLHLVFVTQHIPKGRIKPLGTADAVFQALEQFPELQTNRFSVCNSDNLYTVSAFRKLRSLEQGSGLIAYDSDSLNFTKEKIAGFALLVLDSDFYLQNIVEKPATTDFKNAADNHESLYISMNAFTFDGNVFFSFLRDCPINLNRDEKELPTALLNMIEVYPNSVRGIPMQEHVPDLTTKEDLLLLEDYLNLQKR